MVGTKLAGFALVRQGAVTSDDSDVMDLAEFFVLRRWRRRGVGQTAACALFKCFPGCWEVRVMGTNVSALLFWENVISAYAGNQFQRAAFRKDNKHWQVFHFRSKT